MSSLHDEETDGASQVPIDNRPTDTMAQSRFLRIVTPIWMLVTLGSLVWTSADHGDAGAIISMSFVFVGSVVLLIRTRRPMHTWPAWLFTVKR